MEIMSWWNNVIFQIVFIEKNIECDHLTNSNDNNHW